MSGELSTHIIYDPATDTELDLSCKDIYNGEIVEPQEDNLPLAE